MNNKHTLFLIKEKLKQMGPEEVLRQLYACRTDGPSVKEFITDHSKKNSFLGKKS